MVSEFKWRQPVHHSYGASKDLILVHIVQLKAMIGERSERDTQVCSIEISDIYYSAYMYVCHFCP